MCNPVTTARPDALLAKGVHEGFEWEVTDNGIGYRCGYVRVPPGHPWHGKGYDEVGASVHGGLTFAEPDAHCGKGGPGSAWWLGFDCAHFSDAPDPGLSGYWVAPDVPQHGTVRTTEYVTDECLRLINQAIGSSQRDT